jgi:hypothetical protein
MFFSGHQGQLIHNGCRTAGLPEILRRIKINTWKKRVRQEICTFFKRI